MLSFWPGISCLDCTQLDCVIWPNILSHEWNFIMWKPKCLNPHYGYNICLFPGVFALKCVSVCSFSSPCLRVVHWDRWWPFKNWLPIDIHNSFKSSVCEPCPRLLCITRGKTCCAHNGSVPILESLYIFLALLNGALQTLFPKIDYKKKTSCSQSAHWKEGASSSELWFQ